MVAILRALLTVLGVSAVLICLSIMLFGPTQTAFDFERGYVALTGWRGSFSGRWPATMDSESRFYAPLFGAYGILLLMVARDLSARGNLIPWLAGVFFVGGIGRFIS